MTLNRPLIESALREATTVERLMSGLPNMLTLAAAAIKPKCKTILSTETKKRTQARPAMYTKSARQHFVIKDSCASQDVKIHKTQRIINYKLYAQQSDSKSNCNSN